MCRDAAHPEDAIWFTSAFPMVLALAAGLRFIHLLCKKQLMHAFLQRGYALTKLPTSNLMDKLLVAMLAAYGFAVLCLVSENPKVLALAATALAGPSWALLKAIGVSQEMERLLQLFEFETSPEELTNMKQIPNAQLIPWNVLLKAGRQGRLQDPPNLSEEEDQDDFKMSDILWQRHAIWSMTRSRSSYLILPGFAALLALSLFVSAAHVAAYSCSRGELTDLTLPSSTDALQFHAWQTKYEVTLGASFRRVGVSAFADDSRTRKISFTQPPNFAGKVETNNYPIGERISSAVEEVKLSKHFVPRVASIEVPRIE